MTNERQTNVIDWLLETIIKCIKTI